MSKMNKIKSNLKSPLGICILYTLMYIVIYRAIIGLTLYQYWGVSDISAMLGAILGGGGDDYPTDGLETFAFVLLFIEIISFIILKSKNNKKGKTLLNTKVSEKVESKDEVSSLEKLKYLKDKDLITQEDFDKKKEEILKKL